MQFRHLSSLLHRVSHETILMTWGPPTVPLNCLHWTPNVHSNQNWKQKVTSFINIKEIKKRSQLKAFIFIKSAAFISFKKSHHLVCFVEKSFGRSKKGVLNRTFFLLGPNSSRHLLAMITTFPFSLSCLPQIGRNLGQKWMKKNSRWCSRIKTLAKFKIADCRVWTKTTTSRPCVQHWLAVASLKSSTH